MARPLGASADEVRDIGSRLELFVDDWLIERMQGVSLKMHHPVPLETALQLDRPWEGEASYDPVVIKDGGRFRMWYRSSSKAPRDLAGDYTPLRTCYAESGDGVHWERPSLGMYEFNGTTDNNIILEGNTAKAVCVFKDGNPTAPNSERYKAIGVGPDKVGDRATLRGLVSPDGLHWKVLEQDPILVAPQDAHPIFDSHNVAFWDALQGQYVAYMRGWIPPGVRNIRRSVSADFRGWSRPEFIDLGDSPTEHLYKNACSQYFRAPHLYLMFPKRFVPGRKFHQDSPRDGISESVFMTSRDGVHWDRRFMEAFLRPGPDPKNWTDRNMYIGPGLVPTGPAEMSLYFIEHYRHPTIRLRRTVLRTDGLVSVNAPYSGGELVTRPLTFEGGELVINYSTSVAGSLRAEIQDEAGRPLEGYHLSESQEVYGDEIERVVAWKRGADVGPLVGRPVRVRFVMKEADLFSVRFRQGGRRSNASEASGTSTVP